MALTLATELANYAAGIGTQGATLKIDSANKRVGVGTTNPQGPEGSLQVGTGITFFGNTGIISAIGGKFSGDFTVGGTLTYEDVQNVNSSGVGTFSGGINVVGGGLTVTGVSTFFSTVSIGDSIVHTGDTDTSIRFPAAGAFTINTNGSERVRVNSSGFVGVNTDSPGRQLTVSGSASEGVIQITNNTSGGTAGNGFELLHFTSGETQLLNRENAAMRFDTNNTERLRITSAGKIGINDNSPERAVDIRADNVMVQLEGTGGNGRQYSLCSTDDTTGASVGPAGNFVIYDDTSGTARLRINSSGITTIASGSFAIPSVPEANTDNAELPVLFQTQSGTVDGGSGLSYNPAGDVLSVNGLILSSTVVRTTGSNTLTLTTANGNGQSDVRVQPATVQILGGGSEKLSVTVGGVNVTGITTATQLFEGSNRVATTGKAIAMAFIFG